MCDGMVNLIHIKGKVELGDIVIVTAGMPFSESEYTGERISNQMKIAVVQ
jgi:hypothetical protein